MRSPREGPGRSSAGQYITSTPGRGYILRDPMDTAGTLLFLLTALIGSYVQSVAGFAMGMIMIAVMVGSGLVARVTND